MPQYAGIYVTMNPGGDIVLSRVTHQMMGGPAAVLLLYDRTNLRIGLKPTALTTRNAYPLPVSNNAGAKKVHTNRLVKEHRIDLPHTVRFYDAEIDEDGVLILNLRTSKPCPRAASRSQRQQKHDL